MTDITELAQLKAAIKEATPGEWYVDYDFDVCTENYGFIAETHGNNLVHNAQYIALANPQNILALVEALEKAQQVDDELCKLLPPGVEYMDPPDGGDVTPLEGVRRMVADYRQRIAELEPIRAAAEKLVRCKGRYHSEQNYRALAALFGVNTPDLPPLDSEPRTVTVDADVSDRNQPGMVVAVHIDAGDFVKVKGQVYEVEETDFDDHDVTLWFVGGETLKCAAGCQIEVVSAPRETE